MGPDEARQVLGVSASATPAEIKAAYRRLVKAFHPDRDATDEERRARAEAALRRTIEAYQCLRHSVPPHDRDLESGVGAASPSARHGRTVRPRRWRRSRRARRARVALRVAAVASIVAVILGVWLVQEPASWEDGPMTGVAEPPTFWNRWVDVEARRIGRDWRVRNPTNRTWRNCTAWVGGNSLRIGALRTGDAPRTLLAENFTPGLDADEDQLQLELMCSWP